MWGEFFEAVGEEKVDVGIKGVEDFSDRAGRYEAFDDGEVNAAGCDHGRRLFFLLSAADVAARDGRGDDLREVVFCSGVAWSGGVGVGEMGEFEFAGNGIGEVDDLRVGADVILDAGEEYGEGVSVDSRDGEGL